MITTPDDTLAPPPLDELDPSQVRAVEMMCTARVGIVTGGPGTGKTHCLRHALDHFDASTPRVSYALACPTGKGARRMTELTGRAAQTVHRLLGWYPPEMRFLRGPESPIAADVVIVDEASMLDLRLADSLLAAIGRGTRLVLIGDHDQLPSVGPGAVLADMIRSGRVPVARLTTLHRAAAERWVASQAPVILRGEVPDLRERADFLFVERDGRDDAVDALVGCFGRGSVTGRALLDREVFPEGIQVLVPQNVGRAGADVMNARLQRMLNASALSTPDRWRIGDQEIGCGDRVIQTKNFYDPSDESRDVMNGETGVVTALSERELEVCFDDGDDDDDYDYGKVITYDRDKARHLRLAYALTIHKAQGSEFAWVVVLCHSTHTRMLSRNLLYTAVTRAREGVVLVGDRVGLERAVKNVRDARRNTGLAERLRCVAEAAGDGR